MKAKSEQNEERSIGNYWKDSEIKLQLRLIRFACAGGHSRCLDYIQMPSSYHIGWHNVGTQYIYVKLNHCLETEDKRTFHPLLQ